MSLQSLYAPSSKKFVVLSVSSFGFYLIYWGYKNWKIIQQSGRTHAWAPVCGFFLPITLFSLLDKLEDEVKAVKREPRTLNRYAIGFLGLNLLKLIPVLGILLFFVNFLPLLPINRTFAAINEYNQNTRADYLGFGRWSIVWLVLWGSWLSYHLLNAAFTQLQ